MTRESQMKARAHLTSAVQYIESIHEMSGERGLLNHAALAQTLCRKAIDEIDAALAAQSAAPVGETWMDGAPDKPWSLEWFIAETTYGDRVVLVALPDEWTYDFKTADETYIKRDKIKRWMQFPDSQFVAAPPPSTPQVIDPIGLIHECAGIADKYDDCGGSFIAEKIRELVFSRAKPGDS